MGLSEPVQKPAEAEHIDLRTFGKRSHTPFPAHFQVLTVTGNSPEFSAFLPEVTGFSTNNKGLAINCSWMRRIQIGENACLDQVPKKNFQPKQPLSPKALPRGRALPPKKGHGKTIRGEPAAQKDRFRNPHRPLGLKKRVTREPKAGRPGSPRPQQIT